MTEYSDGSAVNHAYLAAYEYLLRRWKHMPERSIADELSDMSLLEDGNSADPSCRREFTKAFQAVLETEAKFGRYTRADQQLSQGT